MARLFQLLLSLLTLWVLGLVVFIISLPSENVVKEHLQEQQPKSSGLASIGGGSREGVSQSSATVGDSGIVVFTGGGGNRVETAMALLQDHYGRRLLISGVHPETTRTRLKEFWQGNDKAFECCVDLGLEALTTRGNASELQAWVQQYGFSRIILVTSDFHVHRAQAEARARLPQTQIIAYPVPSIHLSAAGWPETYDSWKIVSVEYSKFMLARLSLLKDSLWA